MKEHSVVMKVARQEIQELRREIRTPGFAHHSEEWMKQHTSTAIKEFQTMLDVLRLQRGWNDETTIRANATLITMLTQGPQRQKVGNWAGMTELADNYLGARIHIFGSRTRYVEKKVQPPQNDTSS